MTQEAYLIALGSRSDPTERWSMDFVHDTLADGRPFRALTVVDNWSRHNHRWATLATTVAVPVCPWESVAVSVIVCVPTERSDG